MKDTVAYDLELLECPKDQEEKMGQLKVDNSFFGYKTHLGMSEERRTKHYGSCSKTGEKNDGKHLYTLIEKRE